MVAENKQKWLIVGGCPRSGTTLLYLLLNTNPSVKITDEVSLAKLMHHAKSLFYREQDFEVTPDRVKGKKEVWNKEDICDFIPKFTDCGLPIIKSIYEHHFGKKVDLDRVLYFGDKYPTYYSENFEALKFFLGEVKVLHISRNPFDVINSMLRRSYNTKQGLDIWGFAHTIEKACYEWLKSYNFIIEKVVEDNSGFLHLKYEDLIFDTEKTLLNISCFLNVDSVYDFSNIQKDNHFEREMLDKSKEEKISRLLNGITDCWHLPLDEIQTKYPRLPEITLNEPGNKFSFLKDWARLFRAS